MPTVLASRQKKDCEYNVGGVETMDMSTSALVSAQVLNFVWNGFVLPLGHAWLSRLAVFVKTLMDKTGLEMINLNLALYYIWGLKMRNPWITGSEGSEYRILVTGLIIADKVLNDYTYVTDKLHDFTVY